MAFIYSLSHSFKIQKLQVSLEAFCTQGGNRTHTLLPELDFESSASTNSATRANFLCGKLVCKTNYLTRINKI